MSPQENWWRADREEWAARVECSDFVDFRSCRSCEFAGRCYLCNVRTCQWYDGPPTEDGYDVCLEHREIV